MLAIDHGEYTSGRDLFEEQLAMHRELGNKRGIAAALLQLARVIFFSQGDPAMVRTLQEEALDLFRELGDKEKIADSFNTLGWLALAQGDAAKASSLTEKALTIYHEMSQRPKIADTLGILADIAVAQGDYLTARAFCEQGLAEAFTLGNPWPTAFCLEGLADIVAAQGELTWAARLWGAAAALREMFSLLLPPVWHASYERTVAAAREHLGERAFAAAWEEGRTMTPEQALAEREPMQKPNPALTAPSSAAASPPSPAGLTAREMDVLRLLAQGLTSAQIAEQLVIGLVTVNSHVRSIYNKLGVSSRAAATRYALEHHLL
jgi:ATP/maltotriose-dependent transcriptional regulator MalT